MSKIALSRTVEHPIDKVWAVLADFGGVCRWSAAVETSPINPGKPSSGVGAERNCHLYDGNNLQERVVKFVENERLVVDVFQTSMPLKSARGQFDLAATETGGTTVTITFDFVVKYGPVGWLMDVLMMKRMMTGSLTRLLAALDEHMTTGEEIPKGWLPAAA